MTASEEESQQTAEDSMDHLKVDLAVIGSGGAAFAAAIHATGLGKRVLMVERSTIGGTCVNTGCIPSKALIAAAEARHVAADAARYPGITATAGPVDMPALTEGKQELVESLRTDKYTGQDGIERYSTDIIANEMQMMGGRGGEGGGGGSRGGERAPRGGNDGFETRGGAGCRFPPFDGTLFRPRWLRTGDRELLSGNRDNPMRIGQQQ